MAKKKSGGSGKSKKGSGSAAKGKSKSGPAALAPKRSSKVSAAMAVAPPAPTGTGSLVTCSECYEDWEIFPDGSDGIIVCPACGHAAASPAGDTLFQMNLFARSERRDLLVSALAGTLMVLAVFSAVWFSSGTGDKPMTQISQDVGARDNKLPVGATEGFLEEGGLARLGGELIQYGGIARGSGGTSASGSQGAITGVTRGAMETKSEAHPTGTFVVSLAETGSRPTIVLGSLVLAVVCLGLFVFKALGYERHRWAAYF